jgi:hypothetical protein
VSFEAAGDVLAASSFFWAVRAEAPDAPERDTKDTKGGGSTKE